MIRRTPRETVMLEALEFLNGSVEHVASCLNNESSECDQECPVIVSQRALATVKALDDAEMAARGPGSAGGEVVG